MKRTGLGHTAYHHVGDDATPSSPGSVTDMLVPGVQITDTTANVQLGEPASVWATTLGRLLRIAAVGAAAYHGYRRNNSVGWAIGWGLFAGFSPPITIGIAVAEGFARPRRS